MAALRAVAKTPAWLKFSGEDPRQLASWRLQYASSLPDTVEEGVDYFDTSQHPDNARGRPGNFRPHRTALASGGVEAFDQACRYAHHSTYTLEAWTLTVRRYPQREDDPLSSGPISWTRSPKQQHGHSRSHRPPPTATRAC